MSLKILARTFLGVAMLTAAPVLAADPEPEVSLRFELSLGAGVAGLDSFRSTETAFLVNPKINLGPRPEPWRFRLGIRLVRLPPRKDPWGSFQLTSLPPGLDGQPDPPPRPNTIRGDQLRIGPTTIVAPELEVQFRGVGRFRPSISIGAGFSAEEGASKEIAGFGRFRTSRSNSPLISYGVGGSYDLSDRTALRLEAQALTSFADSMLVEGPQGETFRGDGGIDTTILTTVGLSFRF